MKWTTLKIALIAVISLSQILLLSFFLFYKNLNTALGSWSEDVSMTIYLKTDAVEDEKNKLLLFLKSTDSDSKVNLITRDQAAKDFQKSIGSYAAGLMTEDELIDLVPETVEYFPSIKLSLARKIEFFEKLSKQLPEFSAVEESVFGSSWLQRFSKADHFIKLVGVISFFVLLLAMGFLSALMVRVLIDDSKAEIEVFTLLGATRWSIYKIFLKDLCFTILVSLVFSFGCTYFLFLSLKSAALQNEFGHLVAEKFVFLSIQEAEIFSFVVIIFILFISVNSMTSSLKKLSHLTYD